MIEALKERHSERGTQRETLREARGTLREALKESHSERRTQREALREERGTLRERHSERGTENCRSLRHVQTVVDRSVSRSCASESRGECVRNLPIGAMG